MPATRTGLEDLSPSRRTREHSPIPKHVGKPSPTIPRRSGHAKSKSVDVSAALPSSTPLLNPFRTPRGEGSTGFVAPPPVPPKPSKIVSAVKVDTTAPLLVEIDDEDTKIKPDSNPFRRKSVPNTNDRVEEMAKPPLPPRQPLSHTQGDSADQVQLGAAIETRSLPSRAASGSISPSRTLSRKPDTVPRAQGSQARAGPIGIHHVQPTSLLQPSRLIRDGLLAAQKAREGQVSTRVPSPNNIVTLANYTSGSPNPTWASRVSVGAPRSERSESTPKQTSNVNAGISGRHRSSTFSSITTGGTTSTESTTSTVDHSAPSRDVHSRGPVSGDLGQHNASPFADPHLIDMTLPPPPRRSVPTIRHDTAQATPSFDIIATSGDEAAQVPTYIQGNLSRRSTLKSSTIVDHGLSTMKDLGEDVRRAAEGVGKDLEWMKGGRGGRTLGMTLPSGEHYDGDARRGLIENIERDHTGSTSLSNDFEQKL